MKLDLDTRLGATINEYIEHTITHRDHLGFTDYLILLMSFKNHPIIQMTDDNLRPISKAIESQIENGYLDKSEDSFVLDYLYNVYIALYRKSKGENLVDARNKLYVYLMQKTESIIADIDNHDSEYFFNIFPMLGNIIYLMEEPNPKNQKIVDYVVRSTMNKKFKQWNVPAFHVRNLNEDFAKSFPDGIIPLGMAHGCLKPLLAMAKLFSKGYKQESLLEGINNLFKLYEVFSRRENGLLIWPNFITLDEYLDKSFATNIKQLRGAWCSGNLITAYTLFKVCINMGWDEKSKYYYSEIIKILSQDLDDYNLELPIICHGYSFPLLIINNLIRNDYMDKGNDNVEIKVLYRKKQEILEILLNMLNSAEPKAVMEKHFYSNYSILYGISGVLLSLQTLLSNETSLVEELLLID